MCHAAAVAYGSGLSGFVGCKGCVGGKIRSQYVKIPPWLQLRELQLKLFSWCLKESGIPNFGSDVEIENTSGEGATFLQAAT